MSTARKHRVILIVAFACAFVAIIMLLQRPPKRSADEKSVPPVAPVASPAAAERPSGQESRSRPVVVDATPTRSPSEEKKIVMAADWRDVGLRSPAEALQTHFFAIKAGDVDRLQQTLTMSDEVKKQLVQLIDSLPTEERAKFPEPERLAAFLTCGMSDAQGFVLSREERKDRESTVTLLTSHSDSSGKLRGSKRYLQQSADDSWRIAVTPQMVEDFRNYIRPRLR